MIKDGKPLSELEHLNAARRMLDQPAWWTAALKEACVIGSIRPNRFGGHAAQWIEEVAQRRGDFEVELIDLKDYPMPLFAEEASPLYAPSKDEVARCWQKKVGEFDSFIFTAAEYNRGPTAVLKNALDYRWRAPVCS